MDDMSRKWNGDAYCGKHAGDGEEGQVGADGSDCRRYIAPPPDTGCGEPGS